MNSFLKSQNKTFTLPFLIGVISISLIGCQAQAAGSQPAQTEAFSYGSLLATPTPRETPTMIPPTPTQMPPTLADFWNGSAEFKEDVSETGLPLGESDTIVRETGEIWSYLHASERSNEAVDQCGYHVDFPGCTVIYRSFDAGLTFSHAHPSVCQFRCQQCPCSPEIDHIDQQQYPRITQKDDTYFLVYEYQAQVYLRRSKDGLTWSAPEHVAYTGLWNQWLRPCAPHERIGSHPFVPYEFDCLAGGPPGIFVAGEHIYIFVAQGQSPGALGCFYGSLADQANTYSPCLNNPLISGAETYGPLEETGPLTNPYFDFRMLSAAEVVQVRADSQARYYMLYEGIRGPGPNNPGDTQFGLGLARSETNEIDGRWQKYPGNPILVDLPGNIGLGHADLIVIDGRTYLYTSLDGRTRSRLVLVWK